MNELKTYKTLTTITIMFFIITSLFRFYTIVVLCHRIKISIDVFSIVDIIFAVIFILSSAMLFYFYLQVKGKISNNDKDKKNIKVKNFLILGCIILILIRMFFFERLVEIQIRKFGIIKAVTIHKIRFVKPAKSSGYYKNYFFLENEELNITNSKDIYKIGDSIFVQHLLLNPSLFRLYK